MANTQTDIVKVAEEAFDAAKQRGWVGLTDEELQEAETATWGAAFLRPQSAREYARVIEDKLKEKNNG